MKSQLNLSEKILIFIGFCLSEIGYKFSYQKMADIFKKYYQTHHSITTLRKEFSNLKRAGLITFKTRYHRPIPILSRGGRLKITPHLPFKKFGHWDNKWRVVIFNIPEIDRLSRTILRQKLLELGFKKIQKGVYISPYPFFPTINRLATELGIRQYLTLIEAEKIDREKSAIAKIWNLNQINQEYQDFIREAQETKRHPFWSLEAKILEQKFYEIYKKDPHLPKELLPSDWQGDEGYRIYKEIVMSY